MNGAADRTVAEAMAALQRGDPATAKRLFQAAVSGGAPPPGAWAGLAVACRMLKDEAGMHAALDAALAADPFDLDALLMKGDSLAARGDRRAALSFYGVIRKTYPSVAGMPPDMAREVRRAHDAHAQLSAGVFQHMQQRLATSGYDAAAASPRFTQSLALLSGQAQRYEQQPRSYFFPELPTIAFYPREMFPWMDAIEAATDDIRRELQALLAGPNVFAPYIEAEANRPVNRGHNLLDSPDWTAAYLWKDGAVIPEIAERCPKTLEALRHAPLEQVKGRAPFILFSKLTPGAWIKPHSGFLNTRLVCHLPLIVPEGCWFRVGSEMRQWQEGKCFAFNDTIEHEARNEGTGVRTVLIFNIWRPELSEAERKLVAALLESVDTL